MNHLRLLISSGTIGSKLRQLKCICLLHPRTGKKCAYVVSDESGTIFELQKVDLPKRSLIIGTQISQCGDVFVLSPLNPVFLFLPTLLKMEKFTTVEVLVRSDDAPGFPEIFSVSLFNKLRAICDSKDVCGLEVFRLNEEKLMDWLKSGINRICGTARQIANPIQARHLHAALCASAGDTAVASFYVEDSIATSAIAEANLDGSALQNLAFQIVADKLPGQLIDKLFNSFGLFAEPTMAREDAQMEYVGISKSKFSDSNANNPTEDYFKHSRAAKAASTLSSSQAKRIKMAQGTKPLTAFFGKK